LETTEFLALFKVADCNLFAKDQHSGIYAGKSVD